ncbi:DNA-processing protein DprA [Galbibacter mesophilus]|uniref:DNA-processing protein DprA n=1 Tax=Galbibacter mesophilus TaxID=379069 RepID=UPI00191CFCB9|nr:DNA-processing protein DprA [Galbibacter mesophilus]MCM5662236.1 DNA-processing protein DprA [Galbibacter mesophilus]
MTEKELFFLLALQRAPKVGDITAKKLLQHCGSAENIFNEKRRTLQSIEGIGDFTVKNILNDQNFKDAEKELAYLQQNNIQVTAFFEEQYPYNLKHCVDSPILLFQKGKINISSPKQKLISIVGTRQITSYGTAFCNELMEELATFNPVIVSGYAYGVDICAHKAAMKNNLQTIGCLAHGFNEIYPKAHKKYMDEMVEKGGFITDFWSDQTPERNHFLRRNRIIAGLSSATIVIESAKKGGSLVTADIALSYNREVFAVPGRTNDKYSEGCNNLIKTQQAHLLTSAADLIYILGWKLEKTNTKHAPVQKQLFVDLDATEQPIFDYLQKQGKVLLDVIALDCNMPVHKLSSLLFSMEMKGVVRPLPGKLYEVV